ncbi:myeloid differentiation primary response protein MyD88-A-like isoform X1 [Ostrinia nubilalis]|uniref:myeloid differentiation primary response protein MyD88-A-like isoform X1 n=1 Tax=Ostrinia nubilalis TaxID=29057 RepID=UPI0030823D3A
MGDAIDASAVPLSSFSYEFRTLVSDLLNTRRVITTDGPNNLPRDWRGLAYLLQISSEVARSIGESPDKAGRLLDIWVKRGDGTATLQTLFDYLTRLDRFDLYDDIIELANLGQLIAPTVYQNEFGNENGILEDRVNGNNNKIITYDDRRDGVSHYYHAYVLFAHEDWEFVREILSRMKALGFKLCTEYDLDVEPGSLKRYGPIAQFITERCHRIILVYSPDFLVSADSFFYAYYAQGNGIGIEWNVRRNIIPVIYRKCQPPSSHHLANYHQLVYEEDEWVPYDFWDQLAQTLGKIKFSETNENNEISSSYSLPIISEIADDDADFLNSRNIFNGYSVSNALHVEQLNDSESSSSDSQTSSQTQGKKRTTTVTKMMKFFTGKKNTD